MMALQLSRESYFVLPSATTIVSSAEQPLKVFVIWFTLAGMQMLFRLAHPWNQPEISVTPSAMTTSSRELSLKALAAVVSVEGSVIFFSPLLKKAASPMVVTPSGTMNSPSDVVLAKAIYPIVVSVEGRLTVVRASQ